MGNGKPNVAGLILAAGKGTRMQSPLPKVLHPVCGMPMVERVINVLKAASCDDICLVIGGDLSYFEPLITKYPKMSMVIQEERRGTGDAVASLAPLLKDVPKIPYLKARALQGQPIAASHVLVCAGDTPALSADVMKQFIAATLGHGADLAVLGMNHPEPTGYGRVIKDSQSGVKAIVEQKDATDAQKAVKLCNSGVILARTDALFNCLARIEPNNSQGEYYLTDCFQVAQSLGLKTFVFETEQYRSFDGVNDRTQLARIGEWMAAEKIAQLTALGVRFADPKSTYVEPEVEIGAGTDIGPNVSIRGTTSIGANCTVGAGVVLQDAKIRSQGSVGAFSFIQSKS